MFDENLLMESGLLPEGYYNLSDEEKEAFRQILGEISSKGSYSSYEQLYYTDYDEIPVDFITFISDDHYLGKSTRNGRFLFDFWKKEATKIFSRNDINEVALSGSIGIGKTTAACIMMAYHLYKTMCLKDPQAFFGLSPGSEIVYAFLNNTLSSSYGVGYDTMQSFLKESPWFLKHGVVSGRADPKYYPEKGFSLMVGSRPQHTLGRHIICLTGDTKVVTSEGTFRIDQLEGKEIKVMTYNDNGNVEVSSPCTVKETGRVVDLVEIELEDGSMFKCTPDHRFLLKSGVYKKAKDLTEDDDLVDIQ